MLLTFWHHRNRNMLRQKPTIPVRTLRLFERVELAFEKSCCVSFFMKPQTLVNHRIMPVVILLYVFLV